MRHNGRPLIAVSSLPPSLVNMRRGEPPTAACPVCGRWRMLRQRREPRPVRLEAGAEGLLTPHRACDGHRCSGSGQRIRIDLTPAQWAARLDVATRDASRRTGSELIYRRTRLRYPEAA